MGAHTLTAHALADPSRVAAIVVIGPVFAGSPSTEESLAYWDGLADGLEAGGVDGFLEAYDQGLDPDWRETMLRITRERLSLHRDPGAVAQALREVPRSSPFDDLSELELLRDPGPGRRQPRRRRSGPSLRGRGRRGPSGCRVRR